MKEILPGIFQMSLTLSGFSPDSVNIYLIREGREFCLVDTGWDKPEAVQSLHLQLSEAGISYSSIKKVLITHCHVDHLGLIGQFKRSNGAKIYLHQNELELIKVRFSGGDNYIAMTDKYLESHGVPAAELAPPEFTLPNADLAEPDVLLTGGEELNIGDFCLRVINTPGHTPGHVSFYEPFKKLLFSGDVLLPTIATNAAFHVQHITNPLQQYLNSLLTIRELDIDLVIPGHEFVFSNYRQRIQELIEAHRQKSQGVLRGFEGGQRQTAYSISRLIAGPPREKISRWDQFSGWDKRFAMLQTIAHLEELVGQGRLTRFCLNGRIYYDLVQ